MVPTAEARITRQMLYSAVPVMGIASARLAIRPPETVAREARHEWILPGRCLLDGTFIYATANVVKNHSRDLYGVSAEVAGIVGNKDLVAGPQLF